ncbi:hypothetical protein BJY00DRAFT_26476 [Aspergillus carlsbadensis]|nr:hypothetical protein BJY00DRAFT_26476 [Aspergillus carlsbadensis]
MNVSKHPCPSTRLSAPPFEGYLPPILSPQLRTLRLSSLSTRAESSKLSILVLGRARRIGEGRLRNLRPAVGFTAATPKQHEPRKGRVLDLGGEQAQARRQATLLPAGGLSMTISGLTATTLDQGLALRLQRASQTHATEPLDDPRKDLL